MTAKRGREIIKSLPFWGGHVRLNIVLLSCALITISVGPPNMVFAQLPEAEAIARTEGGVVGAARACGVQPARLRAVMETAFQKINERVPLGPDNDTISRLFWASMGVGADKAATGNITCEAAWASFAELEIQSTRRKPSTMSSTTAPSGGRDMAPYVPAGPTLPACKYECSRLLLLCQIDGISPPECERQKSTCALSCR